MEIPKEVSFDRAELNRLRAQLDLVHSALHSERQIAQAARNRIGELYALVGFRNYSTANKLWDIAVLYRIVEMKEREIENDCLVVYNFQNGRVRGMTRNGYVQIELERGPKSKVKALPIQVERRKQ